MIIFNKYLEILQKTFKKIILFQFSADSFNDAVLETSTWSEVVDEIQSHLLDMKNGEKKNLRFVISSKVIVFQLLKIETKI